MRSAAHVSILHFALLYQHKSNVSHKQTEISTIQPGKHVGNALNLKLNHLEAIDII